ncbi:MAG: hypothetical protein ACJAUF_000034 [Bacteroidia bacterium]|jgi:hypothetical protein
MTLSASSFDSPLRTEDMFVKKNEKGARGIITVPLLLQGADLAYQGIISIIEAKKEDNRAEYIAGLANQRFYGDVSKVGRMDPDNLSFSGFTMIRTAKIDEQTGLTFKLKSSLDTSKLEDIVAGAKFYLTLDSLELDYSKLKYLDRRLLSPGTWFAKKDKKLNMDINVEIMATWIDEDGTIYDNITMGSFFYPIRDFDLATLEQKPLIVTKKKLIGSSYIIPRSTTYCFNDRGNKRIPCYGLGDFNILVTVTESKDNSFAEKTFFENKNALIDAMKGQNISDLISQ